MEIVVPVFIVSLNLFRISVGSRPERERHVDPDSKMDTINLLKLTVGTGDFTERATTEFATREFLDTVRKALEQWRIPNESS